MKSLIISAIILILLSGCASPYLSPATIAQATKTVSFSELRNSPNKFKGEILILGGVIIKTQNKKEGALIEIYQTRLSNDYVPIYTDTSEGRFLALYKGFLDNEIYRPGRKITVAGIIQGEKIMQLDEIDYHYPYMHITEINLFKEEPAPIYFTDPWDYYSPWYPYYPWRYRYNPYRSRHWRYY